HRGRLPHCPVFVSAAASARWIAWRGKMVSLLPFPQFRRHVVIGVGAVFEHRCHARQFRERSGSAHAMNRSTIAYASARIKLSRSHALPDRQPVPAHVYALAFSEEKPARLYLGRVRGSTTVVGSQDLALGLNRDFRFGSGCI